MNVAQRIQTRSKIPIKKALKTLMKHLHETIKISATLKKTRAVYEVPAICAEYPVEYDHQKMIRSLTRALVSKGYSVDVVENILVVAWPLQKTKIS